MGIGPQTLHGARCIVHITADKDTPVGVFNSVSYSMGITVVPIEVLGSLLPVELCQTSEDVVQITCSGFRVLNAGPYADGKVPLVKDLLKYDGVTLAIYDRQGNKNDTGGPLSPILTVQNAKCTGYRTTHNAKGVSDLEITYMGIVARDENSGANDPSKASDMTDVGAIVYPIPPPTA